MVGTFKEFYHFIKNCNPELINIWEDYNNAPNPQEGDKFFIKDCNAGLNKETFKEGIFKKVEFDSNFIKGVAFYYIFDVNGNEYKVYSINDVYDGYELDFDEQSNLYGFWKYCKSIK